MNQINEPPRKMNSGLEFNYENWTADTVITLSNVPWNNTYRDIVKFPDRNALNAYIDTRGENTRIDDVSYARVNLPVKLAIPFNKAYRYNYLRASNPAQPVPNDIPRDYYYFIVDVAYTAPMTTTLIVQLDVWQTFGFDARFGNCYVERGHIGIANGNGFRNWGRDYLTVPEGLDVGGEYQIIAKRSQDVMTPVPDDPAADDSKDVYAVLVASTVDLEADPGDVMAPKLVTAHGGMFNFLPSGASYYIFKLGLHFTRWLQSVQNKPWVTQGIISIKLIPDVRRYYPDFEYASGGIGDEFKAGPEGNPIPKTHGMFPDWRNHEDVLNYIPEEYRHLRKLFTFPYMVLELTTWQGTPAILKPESWNTPNADVLELASLIPPNEKVIFSPRQYNAREGATIDARYPILPFGPGNEGDDNGEYLDVITQIANFPTMAIVNDGAISYMASNAAGISQSWASADWSNQKAMGSAQLSYDQASSGMDLNAQLADNARHVDTGQASAAMNLNRAQTNTQMASAPLMGGINGAFAGPGGVAAGLTAGAGVAVTQAINLQAQLNAAQESLAVRNAGSTANVRDQNRNSAFVRDTNKNLADWANRGDYANQIAGISAKLQDARLTQPSISGQAGGEAIALINNDLNLSLRVKMIDRAAIRRIGDFWHRYGYAVNAFVRMPESLMAMQHFTYWKLTETYLISAPMPESFKQAIRGIFEKGVTVYTDPDKIGTINIADNPALGGIAF